MILDRYVLRQIGRPFVVSVLLIAVLVFLVQARRLAATTLGLGLTAEDAALIFFATLPPFLVIVIPIAFLASVLFGLGRMTADREAIALRAAGVSPLRIARVPILLGLGVSVLCLPIAHEGGPRGMNLLHARLRDIALRNLSEAVRPGVMHEGLGGLTIYARAEEEGALSGVFVYDDRDPKNPAILGARRGTVRPEGTSIIVTLEDGEVHLDPRRPSGADAEYHRLRFERARIGVDIQEELRERTRFVGNPQRMTSGEMVETFTTGSRESLHVRRTERDYWRRYSFPAMGFVFGLLGAAIALRTRTRHVMRALYALLAIVAYFFLSRVGDYGVTKNLAAPALLVFAPNIVLLALGGWALFSESRV